MERLLSSSSAKPRLLPLLPRPLLTPEPRLSPLTVAAVPRLVRTEAGRCRLSASPLSRGFSVRCVRSEGEGCSANSYAPGDPVGGTGSKLVGFVRKVASAGLLALVSTVVLTLFQQLFARPAYASFPSLATKTGGSLARNEFLVSAWTGFFAGCLHTLSGPDHLAALAPLSIGRTRTESAIVGALWGCGHDAGQVIFGLLFLLLKDQLHIEILRTWGTRIVGLTLIAIGVMGIREALEVPTPIVALESGVCDVGVIEPLEAVPIRKKKIGFATFATGIVHGLQPDALLVILPALALPSRLAGAAFLGMFLMGTVFAMGSYAVLIGSFSQALKDRVPRITEKLTWISSLVAICMGLGVIISQFLGFSLY